METWAKVTETRKRAAAAGLVSFRSSYKRYLRKRERKKGDEGGGRR
jgi:hypothetical protein